MELRQESLFADETKGGIEGRWKAGREGERVTVPERASPQLG